MLGACLAEYETCLRKHEELNTRLETEPERVLIGISLAISTEKLKYGLSTEIKSCTHRWGQFDKFNFDFVKISKNVISERTEM